MKRLLLGIMCLASLNAMAQKIDFDFQGKTGDERHTEAGFLNWPIASKATDADTIPNASYPKASLGTLPEGMQIICCNPGTSTVEGYYTGIVSAWAKNNVESNTLSRMAGDAVCTTLFDDNHDRYDPTEFSTLRFVIKGMAAGRHTLLAYHNCTDKGHGQPPMVKALVNGTEAAAAVQQTIYADVMQSNDDIATTFISFDAVEGQDVVIDYVAVPAEGVEYSNHRVYVCGMVFDAADPNMKVTGMSPLNGNLHVNAADGSVTLSWTGSASAASHRVMFGMSEENLAEVQNTSAESYTATGLSCMETYYWRIDEIPAAGDPVLGDVFSFRINRDAFPGAEGYGRYAIGGRGGQVVHVTSLEDDGTEGTLRYALETVTGPRTIVFDVSGIITLTKALNCNEPYVTIAGQTAPGDGILIRGQRLSLHNECVARFIRLRMGTVINEEKGTGYSGLDLQGKNNSIVDHSSVGWVTAESVKAAGNYTENITVQNTIIAEALTNDGMYEDGYGYGFDAGGESGSFHHNLLAHNYRANPNISGGTDATLKWIGSEEIYNNVVYNWGGGAAAGAASKVNFVGNYYKAGPATPAETKMLSINVPKNGTGTMEYYVSGNILDVKGTQTADAYSVSLQKDDDGNVVEGAYEPSVSADTPVISIGSVYETAATAYCRVLSDVGANVKRDATDKRIISEVLNGTAAEGENGMISTVSDSDYDVYENITRASDFDANGNGIADWYEQALDIKDANADGNGDGYTNLENYLNYMATPNTAMDPGQTATFDLREYFAGMNGATFTVEGTGTVEGNTLSIPSTASDTGFLKAKVTAASGQASVTREFNVYLNGTKSGIRQVESSKAFVDKFELYNTSGVLVRKGQGNGAAVDRLNLQDVAPGVYVMKVVDTQGNARSFSILKK